jgi:hypothetical protein
MLSKSGGYFANPHVGRQHDAMTHAAGKGEKSKTGRESDASEDVTGNETFGHERPPEPAHSVHTHRHEDGSYHNVTHHADGRKVRTEHEDYADAMEHHARMMHEDGAKDDESDGNAAEHESGRGEERGAMSTLVGKSDDGAY